MFGWHATCGAFSFEKADRVESGAIGWRNSNHFARYLISAFGSCEGRVCRG